jgi:anti-sigma factor RsiW
VRCEEARSRLAEHLLGILDESDDADVRAHLRGCAACRVEMAALDEGLSTYSRAAHDVEPPDALQRRVLTVLEEEWSAFGARNRPRRLTRWPALVAALMVFAGLVVWGVASNRTADRYQAQAARWTQFLEALGGEDVRVGTLRGVGTNALEGNVVVYDSEVGQSWALVLVRAPGVRGTANVTLSVGGRRIRLPELEFDEEGEAHTWVVTESSLRRFETVTITSGGVVLATADVSARPDDEATQ